MSKIDYQALREAAVAIETVATPQKLLAFRMKVTPQVMLALLDERERNQQYIKRRDQENEDIALTVGKLLIENGRLVADTLRHLADNEIDSDYFAITSTNENGTEIDHEMAITDYCRNCRRIGCGVGIRREAHCRTGSTGNIAPRT